MVLHRISFSSVHVFVVDLWGRLVLVTFTWVFVARALVFHGGGEGVPCFRFLRRFRSVLVLIRAGCSCPRHSVSQDSDPRARCFFWSAVFWVVLLVSFLGFHLGFRDAFFFTLFALS